MPQRIAIDIRPDDPTPAYQQIERGIRRLVASGLLRSGERLPTSRELAAQLGINRSTVVAAYRSLIDDGAATATVGRGTFIARSTDPAGASVAPLTGVEPSDGGAATAVWHPDLSRAILSAARLAPPEPELDPAGGDVVDFAALAPDESLFPVDTFRELTTELLHERGRELLQYGPTQGDPELRELVAADLRGSGIEVGAGEIVIVNGIQQAIDLTLRVLVDPGDAVVVESPTYVTILPSLGLFRADILEVPMTVRGLDTDALERLLERRRPKLLYTMPSFQNPTGITMDLEARQRLLALAARHRVPILEDDYERNLRFTGDALPTLKALDATGLVFYMGTFSKGLFPGLRLGWLAAPQPAIRHLHLAKRVSDLHTGSLTQAAVARFCARGHYRRHVEHLRDVYRERQRVLLDAMERHLPPGIGWTRPEGGFVLWVTLPPALGSSDVLRDAREAGVIATPGGCFFHGDQGEQHLRLSFARTDVDAIERGIRALGAVMRRRLAREPEPRPSRRPARALPQL